MNKFIKKAQPMRCHRTKGRTSSKTPSWLPWRPHISRASNVPRVTMFDTELISANIPKPIYKFVLLNPSFGFQYLLIEKLICLICMIHIRTTS